MKRTSSAIPCCYSVTLATSRWPRAGLRQTSHDETGTRAALRPPFFLFHFPLFFLFHFPLFFLFHVPLKARHEADSFEPAEWSEGLTPGQSGGLGAAAVGSIPALALSLSSTSIFSSLSSTSIFISSRCSWQLPFSSLSSAGSSWLTLPLVSFLSFSLFPTPN